MTAMKPTTEVMKPRATKITIPLDDFIWKGSFAGYNTQKPHRCMNKDTSQLLPIETIVNNLNLALAATFGAAKVNAGELKYATRLNIVYSTV